MSGTAGEGLAVRAWLLGARLDTRGFEDDGASVTIPLTLRVEAGHAFLFRWGAVVLVGVSAAAAARLLDDLAPRVTDPIVPRESEQAVIRILPGREDMVDPSGAIILREATTERLQVVADALAKSLVLAHYEGRIASAFDRIEPVAERLRRHGTLGSRPRDLLRQIGAVLRTQQQMVGRVEVAEEPEVLWDHPEFKRLYARLEDEYELRERSRAIEHKLDLVQDSVATLLDLVQTQRSLRLELLVIILIGIEIAISFYEVALRGYLH